MINVKGTLIANRSRAINCRLQIYSTTPPSGQNYFRSDFTAVKNDQNLHRVNTSYVTKVVEKQQILIVKNFQV
jgi:hypothetical protein